MILQISILFEFYPVVGLVLIIFGGFVSIMGLFINMEIGISRGGEVLVSIIMGAGMAAGIIQIHQSEPFLLVLVFSLAGKYIQGLAALSFYQKISYAVENRTISLPGASFKTKVIAKLVILFIILVSGIVLSSMAIANIIAIPLSDTLVATWTLFVILYTAFGLTIKLRGSTGDFPQLFVAGLIMLVTGSEVYNLSDIRLEIILIALTTAAFSIGFWIASTRFLEEKKISGRQSY